MSDRYTGQRGELYFEDDLVAKLVDAGWTDGILNKCTVKQHGSFDANNITSLEGNFRNILFMNNKKELNNVPLSDSEFDQIMSKVNAANTPVKANILINGKTLSFKRDVDSTDTEHAGKTVHLTVFEQAQIASGDSKYQIARQTVYETETYYNDRRGDVTLLINGLPVIHLELKARNVDITDACNQIQKYKQEGVFDGLMGLVQVFFAMNPDDSVYFANYGDWTKYNDSFVFHWANEASEQIKDWNTLIAGGKYAMLSIPEAHQLVGYYTVADKNKDVLKVMRSYQYFAVRAICARTKKQNWGTVDPLGGINWCTTGGGKTMSSFKSGQLIRDLCLADKIVFVVDRTELNNQSLEDYNSFSRDGEEVQETVSSADLFRKLKSDDTNDALIVTSIQKMNNIRDDAAKLQQTDLDKIKAKRVVYIVDEAQRSQFGEMHERVKKTFPTALFFGFTGTPIMGVSEDDTHDSRSIFGDYISIYTIASGIKDGNVLGFDPKAVPTYSDHDLKEAVALKQCNANTVEEAKKDKEKWSVFRKFMNNVDMPSEYKDKDGKTVKGIESYLPTGQYNNPEHRQAVVQYIIDNWDVLSIGEKGTRFHALLSTSSIPEAIEYYRLFKTMAPDLNVTALFDGHIGNSGGFTMDKETAIVEILKDYQDKYGVAVDRKSDPDLKGFKKDIMLRLAHKKPYEHIGSDKTKIIDILIVVNQLLTGYDSQYINTLYLDDVIESSNLIQAISRTNRVYDKEEKPFGIFRFFRKVHTMQNNLEEALRLYCEGDSAGVVVATIEDNINEMNALFTKINKIFDKDGIKKYNRLPKDDADCQEFKKLFGGLKGRLNTIRLQGGLSVKKNSDGELSWDSNSENGSKLLFDSETYNLLAIRCGDLIHRTPRGAVSPSGSGFSIDASTSEIQMAKIDTDYLEAHFKLIVPKLVDDDETEDNKVKAIDEFAEEFGRLTERQQKYARQILDDIKNKVLVVEDGKKFADYISEYMDKAVSDAIHEIADRYGIDEQELIKLIKSKPNSDNLNVGQRFTILCNNRDIDKVKAYYSTSEGMSNMKMQKDLKKFILEDVNKI